MAEEFVGEAIQPVAGTIERQGRSLGNKNRWWLFTVERTQDAPSDAHEIRGL